MADFYTREMIAEKTGIPYQTITRWLIAGWIPKPANTFGKRQLWTKEELNHLIKLSKTLRYGGK